MKKEEKDEYDRTYGLFKFKRPLPNELESAMGLTGESTLFKKMIMSDYDRFYETIKAPEEGDWLLTHKEYGQTYDEYINNGIIPVDSNHDCIYIAPLSFNSNESMDQDFVTNIFLLCEKYFYGMKIRLIEISSNFNSVEVKTYEDGKMQINAEQLNDLLSNEIPSDAFCLIGLIDTDLYSESLNKNGKVVYKPTFCTKNISKRTCLLSFSRYDPFFNKNKKDFSKEKKMKIYLFLLKRVCKAITKEICTMFGLKNCIYFSCNMNGSNSMMEFDNKPIELCPICLRKLITNINMKGRDVKNSRMKNPIVIYDRFCNLRDVLQENFYGMFDNEVAWLNARIEHLKKVL
jgi:archaemetzincin